MSADKSQIFEGYRCLGLVSSAIPVLIRYVEKLSQIRVITAAHNSFLVFNDKLKLIETCVAHDSDINVLQCDAHYVFTAADSEIFGWKHGHRWKTKSFVGSEKTVTHLLPFGAHLMAVDGENTLRVWEVESEEMTLSIPFGVDSFEMSAVLHPATYLNKILIGSRQGSLQLWNVRTQKCVYAFNGWNSKVNKLTQAPAVDIVAIGLESGLIVIHNLKCDETLMKFRQEWGQVLDLTFRTDGPPFLVSSAPNGYLAIWNLEKKRLETHMSRIHFGPIVGANFVNREPLLVTNSTDNTLKIWCFDQSDSTGRLLYQREGHRRHPSRIRFYGERGDYILSAGLDSTFRAFCTFSERLNKNLGTASFNRKLAKKVGVRRDKNKMPPIVEFASEITRDKEWDSIAACHRRLNIVTTWSYNKTKMGEHKLMHPRFRGQRNVVALCCCLSSCGNFVIIGYNQGYIDKFNIQSGIYRGTYGEPTAHNGSVRGVAIDSLNQFVISGGNDSQLIFWRFKTTEKLDSITLDASISQLLIHKESSLLAISLDNFFVNVVDCETRRIIRIFGPHGNRVTDMTFDKESRWLITACMDSVIRVFNLQLGRIVDAFRLSSPCVSLDFSPTGEFLATAHSGDIGIYLWSNCCLYSPITLHPLPDDFEPRLLDLPRIRSDAEDDEENTEETDGDIAEDMEVNQEELTYRSPEQISEELITLSLLPQSRWKYLLKLDLIKKRNKPKEPVTKSESAPFFLPTIPGVQPKFAIEDSVKSAEIPNLNSHIIEKLNSVSPFGELILSCSTSYNYLLVIDKLKELGPSMIDAEIRSLSSQICGTNDLMLYFLEAMLESLKTNRDFELIQSYLGLFLKIHTEEIVNSEELRSKCEELSELVESSWNRLSHEFNKSICLINYLKSAVL